MKTARFATIVAKCGEPTTHLVLIDPAKDKALRSAVKAQKVLTVFQSAIGNKTDRGEVGFKAGPSRQFLVFPKSLKKFEGCSVVGIKYDLLSSEELPKSQRAAPATAPKKAKPKVKRVKDVPAPTKLKNVVAFKADTEEAEEEEENEEVAAIKNEVRRAMKVLEDGKAVAAFNLMKRIVES